MLPCHLSVCTLTYSYVLYVICALCLKDMLWILVTTHIRPRHISELLAEGSKSFLSQCQTCLHNQGLDQGATSHSEVGVCSVNISSLACCTQRLMGTFAEQCMYLFQPEFFHLLCNAISHYPVVIQSHSTTDGQAN